MQGWPPPPADGPGAAACPAPAQGQRDGVSHRKEAQEGKEGKTQEGNTAGTGVVKENFSIRREPGGESLQNHSSRSAALKAIQEKDVLAQFC